MNLDNIYLEPHQRELMTALVAADRELPPGDKEEFLYIRTFGKNQVQHPGLPSETRNVFHGDMEALRTQNLIIFAGHKHEVFNIAPKGFAFVNAIQTSTPQTEGIERDQVFISYSHRDAEWLEHLQIMLKPLTRNHKITVWDDTKICGGDKWRKEIGKALASAKVAVMLVSKHFLASDFIAEHELPPLLEAAEKEGVKILWVMVSDCCYEQTELADFQAVHDISRPLASLSEAERDRVLKSVCQQIAKTASP